MADKKKSKKSKRSPLNDVGMHILKGAVVSVLGEAAAVTKSVKWNKASQATLTIQFDADITVTDEQKDTVQMLANEKIAENATIKIVSMDRKEAESFYVDNKVNQTYIYDMRAPPADVETLTICEIEDWNVNACDGEHCATTGEVGGIFIKKFSQKKGKLEILFNVGDSAVASLNSGEGRGQGKGGQQVLRNGKNKTNADKKSGPTRVEMKVAAGTFTPGQQALHEILDQLVIPKSRELFAADDQGIKKLKEQVSEEIEDILVRLINTSYTQGFEVGKQTPVTQPLLGGLF